IERYLATRRARFGATKLTLRSALFVTWRGEPMRRGGLQYLVSSAVRRAGLEAQRPDGAMVHSLRHTYATRLAESGAAATEIMNLLGHASLNTSQDYINVAARELRRA